MAMISMHHDAYHGVSAWAMITLISASAALPSIEYNDAKRTLNNCDGASRIKR